MTDGDAIPDGLQEARVERLDQLFHGVRKGPSLRLVVGADEEPMMARHGYRMASLRKRL